MANAIGGTVGLPRLDSLAPAEASRALELRRFSDPGLIEANVPSPLLAYRCVPGLLSSFGVSDPSDIHPGPHRVPGYLVCVHGRTYIQPLLLASACDVRGNGAVLELHVPPGAPALWVAGTGDPSSVNGADLVCLDNVSIELTGWREEFETTILEFRVTAD